MQKYLTGSTRQLNNLEAGPSKDDPRPLFDLGRVPDTYDRFGEEPPFRTLRWHPVTGDEVCATSPADLEAYEARGYVKFPPKSAAVSPLEAIQAELAELTPDERKMVEEAQRRSRLEAIQKKLSALSPDDLDNALAGAAAMVPKRGPGRPRKTVE